MMRRNLLSLYGVQAATLLLPLLTVPFLARTLGPASLGELAAVQSLFGTLGVLLEYGFNFSATRQVAIHQGNKRRVSEIFAGVIGAKLLLSLVFAAISALLYFVNPVFHSLGALYWMGFLVSLVTGFNLLWFYQGLEKLSFAANIDIAFKFLYTGLLFLFVRSAADLVVVLSLQFLTQLLTLGINAFRARQFLLWVPPSLRGSVEALRAGRSMFIFRGVTLMYSNSSTAILRTLGTASAAGQYSVAERLINVSFGAFTPINQVLFPRLSHAIHHDREQAKRLFKKALLVLTLVSVSAAAAGYFAAPLVIRIVFGEEFAAATDIFRILLLNIPAICISSLFGLQWMVPNEMETKFTRIVMSAALVYFLLVATVAAQYQALGMAWTSVLCEVYVAVMVILAVLRSPRSPFSRSGE